jgi:hypothetical protein
MNSWQRLNQYLLVISRAFGAMLRLRTWTPFLLYLLAQAVLGGVLYFGVRPPLNGFFYALPDYLVPPGYFSYPMHLLLIPSLLYNQAMLPLGLLLESLLQAAATWMFVRYALSEPVPALGSALRRVRFGYGQFVLIWLLNYALVKGSSVLFGLAFDDLWVGFARRRAALEMAQVVMGSIFNSLLAYATIVIVVERTPLAETLRLALQSFKRYWLVTFVTVLACTLFTVPFGKLLASAPTWIAKFNPEVILAATGLALLAGTLASYLVTAILSFWYLMHKARS